MPSSTTTGASPIPPPPTGRDGDDGSNVSTPHARGGAKSRAAPDNTLETAARDRANHGGMNAHNSNPARSSGGSATHSAGSTARRFSGGGSTTPLSAPRRTARSHHPSSHLSPRPQQQQLQRSTVASSLPLHPPLAPPLPPPTPSFTDQIAQSAVSTTVELLKLATGATLSTTGKLYGPSLQVTKTILLPSIFAAAAEYLEGTTPRRLQDWFRILSSSVYHFSAVLTQETPCGRDFRRSLVLAWSSAVRCASSPSTRQVLVDGMACWVRFADAARTPETSRWLDQVGRFYCRVVDAASLGTNRELVQRLTALVWSMCELFADPQTTCALAEVTAYLCHALEMEQVRLQREDQERPLEDRSRIRRSRDSQQRTTYQDPVLLDRSYPPATVEQVILSSLGYRISDAADNHLPHDDDGSSIPSKVVCTTVESDDEAEGDDEYDYRLDANDESHRRDDNLAEEDASTGGRSSSSSPNPLRSKNGWYQRVKDGVRNDVDVGLLRKNITEGAGKPRDGRLSSWRAPPATREPLSSAIPSSETEGSGALHPYLNDRAESLEGLRGVAQHKIHQTSTQRKRFPVELQVQDIDEKNGSGHQADGAVPDDADEESLDGWPPSRAPNPDRLAGESPVEHFYRVLDEVLVQQQEAEVKRMVTSERSTSGIDHQPGDPWSPTPQPRGRVDRPGEPTFRDRIAALRAELEREKREKQRVEHRALRRVGVVAYLACVGTLLALFAISGFALYGAYVFVSPRVTRDGPNVLESPFQGTPSEIVIRVIREVVHVDASGKVLHRTTERSRVSPESSDRIGNCVAEAL